MSQRAAADFKAELADLIARSKEKQAPTAPPDFTGEIVDAMLEHNVRKFFLDELLAQLGWNLRRAVGEEARVKLTGTAFLDYLGVHLETRKPALIFEAKAWEKPVVSAIGAANAKKPLHELIALTLVHIRHGVPATTPVTAEWTEWLRTLTRYVTELEVQSKELVRRVAISSGQWLVIFTNPRNAFVDEAAVRADDILVYAIEQYVACSNEILTHLSYRSLIGSPPELLRPTQLTAYISPDTVRRVFRAVWVVRHSAGSSFAFATVPRIEVYPAVIVERADRVLLTIRDEASEAHLLPKDLDELPEHLSDLQAVSDNLITAIGRELGITVVAATLDEFPGFPEVPVRGSMLGLAAKNGPRQTEFVRQCPEPANEFLFVTGDFPHFLLAAPRVAACLGHEWGECRRIGVEFGAHAILNQSVKPKAYYPSSAGHHCAHRTVHDRRAERCHTGVLDEYLCCKACIYQSVCWPAPADRDLPCGTVADGAPPELEGAESI